MGRSRALPALLAVSAAGASLVASSSAHAWCRTTTNKDFVATLDQPCDDQGLPLYWSSKCIGYSLQRDASPAQNIDLAAARDIAAKSFGQWSSPDHPCPVDPIGCDPAGEMTDAPASISGEDIGPVSCDQVEYDQASGNANIVMFRDAFWPHDDADITLALTTVSFNPNTGEILDADMEINSDPSVNQITTSDVDVFYDLQSMMTHESGHFFGMAHTQPENTAATMYASYQTGATFMRDLSRDDVCGICAAYPPKRETICDPTPRRGIALTCGGGDAPPERGCEYAIEPSSPARSSAPSIALLGGLSFAIGLVRSRRRRGAR